MSRNPIAIIGMGAVYPNALNLEQYWDNIKHGKDAFHDVTPDLWFEELYYSPDRNDKYKSYGKIGAMVKGFEFPFQKYRIPPNIIKHFDSVHLMALESVRTALEGLKNPLTREEKDRTGVVIGNSGIGDAQKTGVYIRRQEYWYHLKKELQAAGMSHSDIDAIHEPFEAYFKEFIHWEPTAIGLGSIPNVLSCLTTYIFDFHGFNMAIDGACASSLTALEIACNALAAGDLDVAVAGGADNNINPELFIGFARVNGLSPDRSHPLDNSANGILMGQGTGVLILKRLDDALKNGDEIHAVIRGIGAASDGGRKAIYAPDVDGIVRSINNALNDAGWTPDHVDYLEAHATATRVGDVAEYDALGAAYGSRRTKSKPIYISAVKELIGHLKAGAGMAGLIKTILAMKNETIPPVANFTEPNDGATYDGKGLAISNKAIPWEADAQGMRRAGISSNGFGGINFHVLLEQGPKYSFESWKKPEPIEYAIVASSCLLPGADTDSEAFYQNMLNDRNNFRDIGDESFDWEVYGSTIDDSTPEKTYSKLFGKMESYKFNSIQYRIVPNLADQMDTAFQYGLDLTKGLGLQEKLKNKESLKQRTAVIIGSMINKKFFDVPHMYRFSEYEHQVQQTAQFQRLPQNKQQEILQKLRDKLWSHYPPSTEETMPGWMPNVLAGRISKVFDIQGANFITDSACSSSHAAFLAATYQLQFNKADQVVVGGVGANRSIELSMVLSAIRAIGDGQPAPFSTDANGFLVGDGGVFYLLKRLKDAEADGDSILCVLSGIGGSSEGSGKSLLASSVDQIGKAIKLAIEKTPDKLNTVDFVETHGAATIGDTIEAKAVASYLKPVDPTQKIYLTAVKSHVGHTLGSAGSTGLLSSLLSLKHKKIPRIHNLREYNEGILSILDQVEPAKTNITLTNQDRIGRAGVISIGLGGSNYFALLREYKPTLERKAQEPMQPPSSPAGSPQSTPQPIAEEPGDTSIHFYFFACASRDEAKSHLNAIITNEQIFAVDESAVLANKAYGCKFSFTYTDKAAYIRKAKTLLRGLDSGMDMSVLESQGIFWYESN